MSDLRHSPNRILLLENQGGTEVLHTIYLDTPGPDHDHSWVFPPLAETEYAPQVAALLGLDTEDLFQKLRKGEEIKFFMPSTKP